MNQLALYIGWGVMLTTASLAIGAASLLVWVYFPIRFDWHNNSPSTLNTPHGELGIKHFIGFSRRRRPEGWFVGAIYLTREPPKQPRVITPKTPTPAGGMGRAPCPSQTVEAVPGTNNNNPLPKGGE